MNPTLLVALVSTMLVAPPGNVDDAVLSFVEGEHRPATVEPVFDVVPVSEEGHQGTVIRASQGEAPSMAGRWLKQVTTVAESSAGPVGTIEVRTRAYQVVDVEQRGRDINLEVQTCSLVMSDDSSMVSTGFSDELASTLDHRSRSGRLHQRNGAWFLSIDRDWELLGMTMEAPEQEQLPESIDDPRVFDQDGDGNPGFTIEVQGFIDGEVYVARRGWDQFLGRINGEESIQGRVKWHSEEKVLDASRRMLRSSPDSVANSEDSRFRMQRINDDIGCDIVEQRKGQLFE